MTGRIDDLVFISHFLQEFQAVAGLCIVQINKGIIKKEYSSSPYVGRKYPYCRRVEKQESGREETDCGRYPD